MSSGVKNRVSSFQTFYKWWYNFGTFEHSKIISLIVLIGYTLFTFFGRYIHAILDKISFINNNPNKISVELRTLTNLLHSQDYIYRLFRINRTQWKGPWNDMLFIKFFDAILNYSMSAAVPTPYSTNISKQTLHKNSIISYLQKNKINFIGTQKPNDNCKNRDYNQFYIENVNLIWIYGNDKIQNNPMNEIIIYLHGGGYSLCGPSHIGYCSRLSLATNCKILFIDYCKPPNTHIPKQVDQILTAYFYILSKLNNSNKIIIAGDSAGAGLCSLLLQKLSFLGLTNYHPIGTLLYSPFIDLTLKGKSWKQFAHKDMIVAEGFASRSGLLAVGNDETLLRSPFCNIIYAPDYEIKSNVMLFVSIHECLYDDSKSLLKKLRITDDAKYKIIYKEVNHCPHAFVVLHGVIPEANEAMHDIVENVKIWFDRNN